MKYNLFGWSKWSDVMVFNFAHCSYVLQGRKHKSGKTKFRVSKAGNFFNDCEILKESDLQRANLWETN